MVFLSPIIADYISLEDQMSSKYLDFEQIKNVNDNTYYTIIRDIKNSMLGSIYYHKPWKKYVFQPVSGMMLSKECIKDISIFMQGIKEPKEKEMAPDELRTYKIKKCGGNNANN